MQLTAESLLAAYANGYFPMAASRDSRELHWFHPEMRGVIPLDAFHVPSSLTKFMRKSTYSISANHAFDDVIRACAGVRKEDGDTWINDEIIAVYGELHTLGFAHSVEVWDGAELIGGLYGVAIGGAFFGESMFSRKTNASKIALVHLVSLLKNAGYALLDTQFTNDHLMQFGVIEIPREGYIGQLRTALQLTPEPCF